MLGEAKVEEVPELDLPSLAAFQRSILCFVTLQNITENTGWSSPSSSELSHWDHIRLRKAFELHNYDWSIFFNPKVYCNKNIQLYYDTGQIAPKARENFRISVAEISRNRHFSVHKMWKCQNFPPSAGNSGKIFLSKKYVFKYLGKSNLNTTTWAGTQNRKFYTTALIYYLFS